jgi:hypothetical protein
MAKMMVPAIKRFGRNGCRPIFRRTRLYILMATKATMANGTRLFGVMVILLLLS